MDTASGTKRSREEDVDDADVGAVWTEAEQEGFAGLPDDILRRIMSSCGDFADRSRLRCCCRSLKRAERDLPPPDWVVVSVFEREVEQNHEVLQPRGSKPGDSVVRVDLVQDRAVLRLSGIRPIRLEVHFIGWGRGDDESHTSMANVTNSVLKHASEQVRVLFLDNIAVDVDICDGLSALRHTLESVRLGGRSISGWQSGALLRSMQSLSGLKHLTGMAYDAMHFNTSRTNVGDFATLLERLSNLEHFETLVNPFGTSWLPYWKRVKENGGGAKLRSLSVQIHAFEDLESLASIIRNHFPSLEYLGIDCNNDMMINISRERVAMLRKLGFLSGLSVPLHFDESDDDRNPLLSVLQALPNLRDGPILLNPSQRTLNSVHDMGGHKLRGILIIDDAESIEATVNGLIGAFPALECVRFQLHLNCTVLVDGESAVTAEYKKNSDALLLLKEHPTLRCIMLSQVGDDHSKGGERRIASLRFLSENLPSIRVIDGRKATTVNEYLVDRLDDRYA